MERIRVRLKRTAEDIIEIGRDLIGVKARLGHGGFENWLGSEFGFSQMQATRFINVAEKFGDSKSNIMLDFKPTILYALAAPSTPSEVIDQATEKAESGEKVTMADVQHWKAEAEAERNARLDAEGKAKGKQSLIDLLQTKLASRCQFEAPNLGRPSRAVFLHVSNATLSPTSIDLYSGLTTKKYG